MIFRRAFEMEEGGNGRFAASTRDKMDELILRMQQERGVPMAGGGMGGHRRTVVDIGGAHTSGCVLPCSMYFHQIGWCLP